MSQQITINQQQLDQLNQLLNSLKDQKTATRRAVRRTATGGKALIAKRLGEKVTLKAAYIKGQIKTAIEGEKATITTYGEFLPLSKFQVYPTATAKRSKNGVTVKVFKDKPPVKFSHAFWATMPNGHVGLFVRSMVGGRAVKRLKIEELKGPTLTGIYEKTPSLADDVETELADRLQRELNAQVAYILSKRQLPP